MCVCVFIYNKIYNICANAFDIFIKRTHTHKHTEYKSNKGFEYSRLICFGVKQL